LPLSSGVQQPQTKSFLKGKIKWIALAAVLVVVGLAIIGSVALEKEKAFTDYVITMKNLDIEESAIIEKYDSVMGDNYTDDENFYNKLVNEIVPETKRFVDKLENISSNDKELRDIHEMRISAWNAQLNGFIMMISALETGDISKVTEANDLISKAKKLGRDWEEAIEEYARKYDISR
jgi:hypothetical protein